MGKNTNTYKTKTIKKKNKNKKLLKKMINSESELDDLNSLIDTTDSILEENIQILVGGKSSDFVEPTELDKLLGYEGPVDTRGPLDKMNDYVENLVGTVANVAKGLVAHKVSNVIGMEGKTPEEVAKTLENDTQKLEQINDYLKKDTKMLDEIQELTNTASSVIGESIKQIPNDINESMNKLAKNAVDAGVGALTDVPGINVVVGTSKMISGIQGAVGETSEAVGKVANLIGDTSEKIEKPINDVKKKINEVSDNIETTQQLSQIQESPKINESQQMNELSIDDKKNIQLGGFNMNKFIHHGGKKLRKRVNDTRHAFKNISKNITKKNK